MHRSVMMREDIEALLEREFPQLDYGGRLYRIEEVGPLSARLRLEYDERNLRPGGNLSGPTMMALADLVLYVAVLANVRPVPLAVTTNLSFNFLRQPARRALVADCHLLKLGNRLVTGEVLVRSEGEDSLVCHAMGTYSIPPVGQDAVS